MNTKLTKTFIALAVLLLALVGCGGAASMEEANMRQMALSGSDSAEYAVETEYEAAEVKESMMEEGDYGSGITTVSQTSNRLIVKTGRISLNVEDTDIAVANAIDVIVGAGGYIVNQNVHNYGEEHRAATLSLGVPVDRFESTLKALRGFGEVESESANGQDVTEEFVDLNSRLENLQATQSRLRQFLAETQNVKDALAVDSELRQVEGEINVLQGRVKYLSDRAAFSTIDVEINPIIIAPQPEPQSWQPAIVAQEALVHLQDGLQNFVDGAIYFGIAVLPWLLIWGVIFYIIYRVGRPIVTRIIQRRAAQQPAAAPSGD